MSFRLSACDGAGVTTRPMPARAMMANADIGSHCSALRRFRRTTTRSIIGCLVDWPSDGHGRRTTGYRADSADEDAVRHRCDFGPTSDTASAAERSNLLRG